MKNHLWKLFNKERIDNQKMNKKEIGNKKYRQMVIYCMLKNKKDRDSNVELIV